MKRRVKIEIRKVVTASILEIRGIVLYITDENTKLKIVMPKAIPTGRKIPIDGLNLCSPHGS